jgi:hypothetical protein
LNAPRQALGLTPERRLDASSASSARTSSSNLLAAKSLGISESKRGFLMRASCRSMIGRASDVDRHFQNQVVNQAAFYFSIRL